MSVDSEAGLEERAASGSSPTDALLGEPRWPPLVAIAAFGAINIALRVWLPSESTLRLPWLIPVIEAVVVVVLLTSDPSGHVERRRLRH